LLQLTNGESDIAPSTWINVPQDAARGIPEVAIAPLLRYYNPMIVPVDSTIKGPADLKGKRIGVYFQAGADTQLIRTAIITKYGFDFFKDSSVSEADPTLLGPSLQRGDLDAIFTFANLGTALVTAGNGRLLFTAADVLADVYGLAKDDPFGIYMTTTDVIQKNPEPIRRYLAAFKEAIPILENDDSVWPDLAKTQNITDPAGTNALRDVERLGFTAKWDQAALTKFGSLFDAMYKVGGRDVTGVDKFDPSLYSLDLWPK
jgi:NitT/TauT family transport system substrate-binding protein